jgi:hypothetical protein
VKQHFIQRNICNGFTRAGLRPLDKDQVLEKITFQPRTSTPPAIEGSISSAFKHLKILASLITKFAALQRSLRKRKLSRRPVSDIQHLEKAAQMAMNMNLLQQETKVLRAEIERKMKKKAGSVLL